ncbi:hypothetical protein CBF23_006560 [Marinomonas agarivorans]|nr:hypothetical protein CBF23_006560 [Marinomonas agarivorans]
MTMAKKEAFQVTTEDGAILNGTAYLPADTPQAVIVINPATAIKTQYYYAFAEFLVAHKFTVLLWNYRCFCESLSEPLSASTARFSDFGTKDIPAILHYAKKRFESVPLIGIGHSVGAQQIGLIPNNYLYDGFIAVAASTGHSKSMSFHYKVQSAFFFRLFGPVSLLLKNYVLCSKFNLMEDLPRHVFSEWKSWCAKEKYLFDKTFLGNTIPVGNYQSLSFPICSITASDDEVATDENRQTFWQHVHSTKVITFRHLTPEALGVKKIGHLGFFRRQYQDTIWQTLLESIHDCQNASFSQQEIAEKKETI